jgi:hypothetical protein
MNLRKVMFWNEPAIAAPAPLVNANTLAAGDAEQFAQPMRAASDQLNPHTAKVIQMARPKAVTGFGEAPLAYEKAQPAIAVLKEHHILAEAGAQRMLESTTC